MSIPITIAPHDMYVDREKDIIQLISTLNIIKDSLWFSRPMLFSAFSMVKDSN